MKYNVILTGSTGMVGQGVLLECLENNNIGKVLVINRTPLDIKHPKLKEVLLQDFTRFDTIKDQLTGYDACFHSMGVSAAGLSEEKYTTLTYQVSKSLADTLFAINPSLVFNYVSGTGTDSSEKGRSMWARVKGKTENYIIGKGFKKAYMFRPGLIVPEKGIRSKTKLYQFIYTLLTPFMGLLKKSKNVTTTTKLGLAMLATLTHNPKNVHLENDEINILSEQ